MTHNTTADVATLRSRIDDLDEQIAALIDERCRVSAAIQAARLAAGGPRVVHAREAEVIAAWRARLGPQGGQLALAVLELARGRAAGTAESQALTMVRSS